MNLYFVRIGVLGDLRLARFDSSIARGRRVLVRTDRGIELAETAGPTTPQPQMVPLQIIRQTSDEDELLIRRLERHKREAVESCRAELAKAGSRAVLLDVDQLFDGGTLVMHFLGEVDSVADYISRTIVEEYESVVRTRHFSKLLRDGCGPGCGTETGSAGGCGGNCSGCAVATACGTR